MSDAPKTIREAQEIYSRREWSKSIYGGYKGLITDVVDQGCKFDHNNHHYLDALVFTETMLDIAKKELRFLTGCNGDGAFSVLETPFIEAVARLQKFGGFVRMLLLDCKKKGEFLTSLEREYDCLDVRLGYSIADQEIGHVSICDRSYVRQEDPHKPLDSTDGPELVTATISVNNFKLTEALVRNFDGAFNQLYKSSI